MWCCTNHVTIGEKFSSSDGSSEKVFPPLMMKIPDVVFKKGT